MSFYLLFGVDAALWSVGIVACLLALRWSLVSVRRRFLPAVILTISALSIGCVGLTRLHMGYSKTVNGQVQWHFDSKWFFIFLLLLGASALACTVWKGRKPTHAA